MKTSEYFTEEELKKISEEIKYLEKIELQKISKKIAEARDKGDLSENAEYDVVKEIKEGIEMRIQILKNKLLSARVIPLKNKYPSKVSIFSTVEVKNLSNGCNKTYTLVNESKYNLKSGKISINTPIAKGLFGKKLGDIVCILLPSGKQINLKILNIKIILINGV